MTFEAWMAAIDREFIVGYGCSVYDLPDQPFLDWFEDGLSVEDAVGTIVDEEIGWIEGDEDPDWDD